MTGRRRIRWDKRRHALADILTASRGFWRDGRINGFFVGLGIASLRVDYCVTSLVIIVEVVHRRYLDFVSEVTIDVRAGCCEFVFAAGLVAESITKRSFDY